MTKKSQKSKKYKIRVLHNTLKGISTKFHKVSFRTDWVLFILRRKKGKVSMRKLFYA